MTACYCESYYKFICPNCRAAIDPINQMETYKRQSSEARQLQEGPPAPAVAAKEARSRSRGEAPTGGALQVKP